MQLCVEIAVTPLAIEPMRYDEFCASLGNPTCFSVLRIDPPHAQACLDIPLDVMFPMIDALLGRQAPTAGLMPHRPLTQFELGSALKIIERAAGQLADSFSRYAPIAVPIVVKAEELCGDPAQVRLMPMDETLTVIRFEVNIGNHHATMRLGLPAPVVDVLCNVAPPMTALPGPADRERDTQNLTQNIMQSAVELRALLADVKLRLSDCLAMQEGDVITTDIPADSPIPLRLGDQTVRFGRLGQLHGNRAFQISDRRPDDGGTRGS